MKTSVKILWILVGSFLLLWSNVKNLYPQQSGGQLFEKALHAEEVKGDLPEALSLYQQILDENPDNRQLGAKAFLHMGFCYEKLGSEQARQAYRNVINRYTEQAEEVDIARDRISRLDALLADLNRKAEQHLQQGNELFKRWEYEDAIKEYENAIKLRPNTLLAMNAQYCIGQSWYRAGKYEEAFSALTDLIEENPNSTIAPVTELMLSQVQYAIKNDEDPGATKFDADDNMLVDPETGITFRKIKTLTGESDIIDYAVDLNLSQNGEFLLFGNTVVPMDGSTPFELIDFESTGVQATRGTWSPDGTKAAFYSGDALCVVPVSPETGHAIGPLRKIHNVENLRWLINPDWSPDGKKLTYGGPDRDIWTINADGTDLKQITKTDASECCPSWSPDGKSIAYVIRDRKSLGLYSLINDSSSEFSLRDIIQGRPVWTADANILWLDWEHLDYYDLTDKSKPVFQFYPPEEAGSFFSWSKVERKMLFFHSSYFGNTGLRIASPEGGPSFEPVHLLTNWGTARWSNDSKWIAVQGEDEPGEIAIRILPHTGGKSSAINLDNLTEGEPFPIAPSSNLEKLIFRIDRDDDKEDLYAVPISAEEARTTGPAVKFFDGWYREGAGAYNIIFSLSPDGEKVALIQNNDIWIAFTNGDQPIKIPERGSYVRWTDNGKALLVNASGWILIENPGPQSRTIELLDGGQEMECRWANIDISPDNSRFAVLTDDQIKIISVEDSKSSKILDISGLELKQCNYPTWSPDGKNLAFIGMKESDDPVSFPEGKYHIYNIPINGGKPDRVAPDDDYSKYELSWSPDGKWIAYSVNKSVKIRPESTMWEADFDEIIAKLASKNP